MINGEAKETQAEESKEGKESKEANHRSDFAPECGALSEAGQAATEKGEGEKDHEPQAAKPP